MKDTAPSPLFTPPRFDVTVICCDKRCPQKLGCARWQPPSGGHAGPEARRSPSTPPLPGRVITLPTLRGPHECRCRPCRNWLPLATAPEATRG